MWIMMNNLKCYTNQNTQVVWNFKNKNTCDCDLDVCKNKVIFLCGQCLQNNSVNAKNHDEIKFQRLNKYGFKKHGNQSLTWKDISM